MKTTVTFLRRRSHSGSKRFTSSAAAAGSSRIPAPTWSIASLELDRNHTPVSTEELNTLCKRALIDPGLLSNEATDALRQDLGNMLHMIQQVQDDSTSIERFGKDIMEMEEDPAVWYYDVPRGVTAAPVRDDDDESTSSAAYAETTEEEAAALKSFLQPKMKQRGAHQYFEIVTARRSSGANDVAVTERKDV